MNGEIVSNEKIADGVYRMVISGEHAFTKPGQFAQVSVPGVFLRRPISVSDWGTGWFSLVYRVVGEGTEILSRTTGAIDVITGLGNGFTPGDKALIVAGGMGVAPMLALVKRLNAPDAALGFKTAGEAFLIDDLREAGARVAVATEDGSLGEKGLVTNVIGKSYKNVYVCGPTPMMKAVYKIYPRAMFSLEARMACGFGACMGCSIETLSGMKRVCREGPVFGGGDLPW